MILKLRVLPRLSALHQGLVVGSTGAGRESITHAYEEVCFNYTSPSNRMRNAPNANTVTRSQAVASRGLVQLWYTPHLLRRQNGYQA